MQRSCSRVASFCFSLLSTMDLSQAKTHHAMALPRPLMPLSDSTNRLRPISSHINAVKQTDIIKGYKRNVDGTLLKISAVQSKECLFLQQAVKSLSDYNFDPPDSNDIVVKSSQENYQLADSTSFSFPVPNVDTNRSYFSSTPVKVAETEALPRKGVELTNLVNAIQSHHQELRITKQAASVKVRPDDTPRVIVRAMKCPIEACGELCIGDKSLFNDHMLRCHQVQRYRCVFLRCTFSSSSTMKLSSHIREEHRDINEWHCRRCAKVYKNSSSLSSHIAEEHLVGHFACSFNGCTFESKTNRKQVLLHLKKHKSFACDQCPRTYSLSSNLMHHQYQVHGVPIPYRCNWLGCGYSAAGQAIVAEHFRKAHLPLFQSFNIDTGDKLNVGDFADGSNPIVGQYVNYYSQSMTNIY